MRPGMETGRHLTMGGPVSDPTHQQSGPGTFWTTVNAAEALPGVSTPLNWTFFGEPVERAFRGTFADLGVIRERDVFVAPSVDDRLWGMFYGRAAANLNVFRGLADLTPGTSGDAFEEQIFGTIRPGVTGRPSKRRYPVAAFKFPRAAIAVPRVLARHRSDIERFWQASTGGTDVVTAAARFRSAMTRFEAVMRPHTLAAMLCQGIYEQLRKLCLAAGHAGLETRLMTGYGTSFEETRLMADLWSVSRGTLSMDAFLAAHGYHGPAEGEISSRSWREDPSPIAALAETYRNMHESASPVAVQRNQAKERETASALLLDWLGRSQRPAARFLLGMASRYIPLREVGKTAFLQAVDVARANARIMGEDLARRGVLSHADDVFYLTVAELLGDPPADAKQLTAYRRDQREEYLRLRLPESWTGQPTPLPIEEGVAATAGDEITGLAVSPGVVEGRARVVTDPGEPLEEGEILVCETTDPSWTSLFLVAGGLVIDIGGALSHGAIVARELGVPCVINTKTGTTRLRTGDLLRVDGNAGVVSVLASA
jgi:phosphohistidine swiveling domain-containing protein